MRASATSPFQPNENPSRCVCLLLEVAPLLLDLKDQLVMTHGKTRLKSCQEIRNQSVFIRDSII